MEVAPILFAFAAALGYSCLDAIAAYNVNIIGMSLFQFMWFRNVRHVSCPATYLSPLLSGSADVLDTGICRIARLIVR